MCAVVDKATILAPLRSLLLMLAFGPALFAGGAALADVWVFIIAPLIGAVLAAWVWKALRPETK